MPIDRVGIGPARPCMLMCERTSVSPLSVSVSDVHTYAHTYVRKIRTCLRSLYRRSTRVWSYTCVTSARSCSYVRTHSKEILPDVRLFLIHHVIIVSHWLFTVGSRKRTNPSNEGLRRRPISYPTCNCSFCVTKNLMRELLYLVQVFSNIFLITLLRNFNLF